MNVSDDIPLIFLKQQLLDGLGIVNKSAGLLMSGDAQALSNRRVLVNIQVLQLLL